MNDSVRELITNPINILKAAFSTLLISLILLATIPTLVKVLEHTYTPTDYYFVYEDVSPARDVFEIGDKLVFASTSEIIHETRLIWNDTLFCDLHDGVGMRHFSFKNTDRELVPVRAMSTKLWQYNGDVPDVPSTCYLESVITAKLQYSNKIQKIIGLPFEIK